MATSPAEFEKVQQDLEDAFKAYVFLLERQGFSKLYSETTSEVKGVHLLWAAIDSEVQGRVSSEWDRNL